ncbi:D-alanyl-D-alanine carboxypeptidase family protein [Rhizohabitans arisaemae]|uniref:D-alanyl-D-alanine carboxypeptidase family protein n=1 Tax=Rhizohabitans arisaemae TaxID=2720610 RepID=UPI0024B0837C|nr:serine hydrolase [Rhizohabitans arisaemae]
MRHHRLFAGTSAVAVFALAPASVPAYAETVRPTSGAADAVRENPGPVDAEGADAEPGAVRNPQVGGALLTTRGIAVHRDAPRLPKVAASSFLIADAETGQVLAARNAHGRFLPASTLKILTALTLIPKLDKAKKIKPSHEACNTEGSAVGLVPTVSYSVDDLLRALMVVSGNDAAVALAEANGGLKPTLAAMNAEAKRLQAYNTVAKTPNGLDKPGQVSSAYDLALLARDGLKNPTFRGYIATKVADFPAPKGKTYQIANHNRLLWQYKGGLGVKNGYTSKARASFVGAAKRNGHTIIVTLMRSDAPFWEDAKEMLDWGFAARGKVAPVGQLVDPVDPAAEKAKAAPAAPLPTAPVAGAQTALQGSGDSLPIPLLAAVGAGGVVGAVAFTLYRRRRARRSEPSL